MVTEDKELEKAWQLDKIVSMIVGEGKPKDPTYLGDIETALGLDNLKLRRYLEMEPESFELLKLYPTFGDRMEGIVVLTDKGKELYHEGGPWFVKDLESKRYIDKIAADVDKLRQSAAAAKVKAAEEHERKQRRYAWVPTAASWFFGVCTLILGYYTLEATRQNELHDDKEERWENEKIHMQKQIDKLNTIPDSIKRVYIN